MFTDEDLDKAKAHFDRTGINAAFVEVPHQGRTLHFNDPAGTPVELVATMKTVPRMHTKIDTHRGAGALRMDHYQVLVPDVLGDREVLHGPRLPDFRLPLRRRRRSAWSAPSCTARTIPGTSCC